MRFVATAPDVKAGGVGKVKYKHVWDINCPHCQRMFYLWTSVTNLEASELHLQAERLTKRLAKTCPEHGDYIPIPD